MELITVVQAWGLPGPHSFAPLTAGYMNLTYRMDSPAGSYVLWIYQAVSDPARIRHEHAVMQGLSDAGLSFRVPAPLRAAAGASLVTVGGVSASLSPFCAGEHADAGSVAAVRAMGAGLGELTVALARFARPVGIPQYRQLGRVHPSVADPEAALRESPFTADQRERLLRLLESVRAGGPQALWEQPEPWLMPEAFTRGYTEYQALAPAEVAALPLLIRLRRLERLMHRYRQGHDRADLLRIMANWVLRADQWLAAHGAELVDRVSTWAE